MIETRRAFLRSAGLGVAQLGVLAGAWPAVGSLSKAPAEPWGELVQVSDGVFAMLSAPLADRTTLCNGGLIVGRERVLMVEAFAGDAGARWMRERSRALSGREVTDVLLTHYHGDHTGGLRGALEGGAALHCTAATRESVATRNQNPPTELLAGASVVDATQPRTLDLGGRVVRVVPLSGHTSSDVAVLTEDGSACFCGDLVWYGMFPNFVDAVPSRLTPSVRALRATGARTFISGHGVTTDGAGMDRFVDLLDVVESAARRAIERGDSAEAAGAAFRMPEALADWTLFSPRYYERAIGAWMRELGASQAPTIG